MPKLEVERKAGEIATISQLLEQVRLARSESDTGAVWLRGLSSKKHKLVPTIGRKHKFGGKSIKFDRKTEHNLLHQFRRYAYEFLGQTLTEWEAMFIGRHHGLPVRLLDWTSNPLAALYFACEYWQKKGLPDSKIWFLVPSTNEKNHIDTFGDTMPFSVKGVKLVYPMVVASRINAQSGYFTIQDDPWKPLDELEAIEYDQYNLDVARLTEFMIPANKRAGMLKDLNDIGVTRRTLFPDPDGLASGLVSAEILRS